MLLDESTSTSPNLSTPTLSFPPLVHPTNYKRRGSSEAINNAGTAHRVFTVSPPDLPLECRFLLLLIFLGVDFLYLTASLTWPLKVRAQSDKATGGREGVYSFLRYLRYCF